MKKQDVATRISYQEYLDRLGNPEKQSDEAHRIFETALKIRNFEIENYWRRANYFWVVLAAIFTGYFAAGLVTSGEDTRFVRSVLAGLGTLFAWAWFFANKGSKFWQENWEAHVDLLEPLSRGFLFQTVLEEKPKGVGLLSAAPYSVSKLNAVISLAVAIIWSGLLIKTAWDWFDGAPFWAGAYSRDVVGWLLIAGVLVIPVVLRCMTATRLGAGKKTSKEDDASGDSRENRFFRLNEKAYANARSGNCVPGPSANSEQDVS